MIVKYLLHNLYYTHILNYVFFQEENEEKLLFSVHPQTMREPTTYYITHEPSHMYKYISKKNMRKKLFSVHPQTKMEAR